MIYFKKQVDLLLNAKDGVIEALRSENARLKAQLDVEAKRANAAVDNLLHMAGSNRVTPPPKREGAPSKFEDLLGQVSADLACIGKSRPIVDKNPE